jgi:hypothetical protein
MYGNLRVRLGAPTRRPNARPKKFPLKLIDKNGNEREIRIPAKLWPRSYPVLVLPEAAILSGEEPKTWKIQIVDHKEDIEALYASKFVRLDEDVCLSPLIDGRAFCRQLAQIAHAYAVGLIGFNNYQDFLVPIIMDNIVDAKDIFTFIGCVGSESGLNAGALCLEIIERRGNFFVCCRFSMPRLGWMFPTYQIVCGIIPDENSYRTILSLLNLGAP